MPRLVRMSFSIEEPLYRRLSKLVKKAGYKNRSKFGRDLIRETRGRGLMLGIELARSCGELSALALEAGLLINVTAGSTVRLLPPLILEDEQARSLGHGVASLINRWA